MTTKRNSVKDRRECFERNCLTLQISRPQGQRGQKPNSGVYEYVASFTLDLRRRPRPDQAGYER